MHEWVVFVKDLHMALKGIRRGLQHVGSGV